MGTPRATALDQSDPARDWQNGCCRHNKRNAAPRRTNQSVRVLPSVSSQSPDSRWKQTRETLLLSLADTIKQPSAPRHLLYLTRAVFSSPPHCRIPGPHSSRILTRFSFSFFPKYFSSPRAPAPPNMGRSALGVNVLQASDQYLWQPSRAKTPKRQECGVFLLPFLRFGAASDCEPDT